MSTTTMNTVVDLKDCCVDSDNSSLDPRGSRSLYRNDTLHDSEEVQQILQKVLEDVDNKASSATDLEKGAVDLHHVVLSVAGVSCIGCEAKLRRALFSLPSIRNLKTSLVLSRAEFEIDCTARTVNDIIHYLERTTPFKYEVVEKSGAHLDLLLPCDASKFIDQPWPDGVTGIKVLDKRTIKVDFDAHITGARDLVQKGWTAPMKLSTPRTDLAHETESRRVRHVGYRTLLSIVLTIPICVMAWSPLPDTQIAYGAASLALATVIQFVVAGPFYPRAWRSLKLTGLIDIDLLLALSTTTAYVFSIVCFGYTVAGNPLSAGHFFETASLLVTLIMVGRWAGAMARQKAVDSISVRSLQSATALLVDKETGVESHIDARLLQYGDIFKVAPGSRVPTDGTVISGWSGVNESMITGETKPMEKSPGSNVIAGSLNGSGELVVSLSRLPCENTLSAIGSMVDEAKLSKPRVHPIADKINSYYVPVVILIALITLTIWIVVGITVRNQSGSEAFIQAITYSITVLVLSTPFATGMAVPIIILMTTGISADHGIIFLDAASVESATKASHVVFNKTGTLTQGKLEVMEVESTHDDPELAQSLLLGLLNTNLHPVSVAIAAYLEASGVSAAKVSDIKSLPGKGLTGDAAGMRLRAGNSRWLNLASDPRVSRVLVDGCTAFCFMIDDKLAAVFALKDSLRPDAVSVVRKLQESGVKVHILSGDDESAVRAIAARLHIPTAHTRAHCAPVDKKKYIHDLQSTLEVHRTVTLRKRSRNPVVIFCGDGTTDASALTQATIGIHINQDGTNVAKSAADIIFMHPGLDGILQTMGMSKQAVNRIHLSFGWIFVYDVFAFLLGAGAFVTVRLPPAFAGLGECVSVLPIIGIALSMRWSKF